MIAHGPSSPAAPVPTEHASTSSADLSARVKEEALLAELLEAAAHALPDLSAATASEAAARANEEALLAGLMETEANLADLAARSLLIEEAQQAVREKEEPKKAQQAAQAKKKPKTKHRK